MIHFLLLTLVTAVSISPNLLLLKMYSYFPKLPRILSVYLDLRLIIMLQLNSPLHFVMLRTKTRSKFFLPELCKMACTNWNLCFLLLLLLPTACHTAAVSSTLCCHCNKNHSAIMTLWHNRLGHPNSNVLCQVLDQLQIVELSHIGCGRGW